MFVRILKVVGVCFAVLLIACGAVVAVFWNDVTVRASNLVALFEEPEYAEGFANRDEMLGYLKAHPEDFSLTVKSDGKDEFSHLPDEPSPLASTKKIVVLAAYAKEVSEGRLDPEEEIRIPEWERNYMPTTDGGAHPAAMEQLDIPTDELGFAENPDQTVRLDDIAGAMISVSDNAATDYLIQRLGQEKIDAVIEDQRLTGQDSVLPLSGSLLVWNGPDGEGTPGLANMSREEYTSRTLEAAKEYASGGYPDEWREGRASLSSLADQRELTARYEVAGTTEDYARIMDQVASEEFISPEASKVMANHLDWPMESPDNGRKYETFGSKGGSLSGVFTQATYAVPKNGGYAGEERVTVLFMRDMSASAWLGVQQSDGYSEFMASLLTDGDFSEKVEREIDQAKGDSDG